MMRRIDLLFALLVCVVGFAAYLGFPYLKGPRTETAQPAPDIAQPPASVAQVPLAPLEPPPPRAPDTSAPAPMPSSIAPSPASRRLDVVRPRTVAARPKPDAAERRAMESVPPARSSYAVTASFGIESFGPPPAPPPRPAAPAPRAVAPVDPLQQVNEAIAACAGAGLFGRIACEQRALLAYCEGRWGKTERCPSGRTTDYGN